MPETRGSTGKERQEPGPQPRGRSPRPYPLEGLRVLDLFRFIAGPFAARLLSDLGADVVKVEPPEGDVTRLFGVVRNGISGLYLHQNAGKRNVAIDLKRPGGPEIVARLAAVADVLIENFRPGVLARFGLDYPALAAENPRLVMLSITGFGQHGSGARRQAYAPIIHAESGWVERVAQMTGAPPRDLPMSFADSIAGLHGLVAVLAALHLRSRTGRGQHVDLAMLDAWLVTDDYLHYALDGAEKPVFQGGEVWDAPGGPLMLNRTLPHVWKLLRQAYGLSSAEPPGADVATKARDRRAAIEGWMNSFSDRDDLKRALEQAGLAWGEIRSSGSLLGSRAAAERGIVALVGRGASEMRLVAQSPYRFSGASSGVRGRAPRLGEHNQEVLREWLGFGDAVIARLEQERVLLAERSRT